MQCGREEDVASHQAAQGHCSGGARAREGEQRCAAVGLGARERGVGRPTSSSQAAAEAIHPLSTHPCRWRHPAPAASRAPRSAGRLCRPAPRTPCPARAGQGRARTFGCSAFRRTTRLPACCRGAGALARALRRLVPRRRPPCTPQHRWALPPHQQRRTWMSRGAATTYGTFLAPRIALAISLWRPPSIVPAGPPTSGKPTGLGVGAGAGVGCEAGV